MTTVQRVITYIAIALAICLAVSIIGGILGALGVVNLMVDTQDAVVEELQTYHVEAQIQNLDIEINAAELSIEEGDSFLVESNLKYLQVKEKGGLLSIEETKINAGTYQDAVLTVYVPAGTVFDNVNLTTGAGRLTIGSLSAKTLDFELGAGDVTVDTLIAAQSADIDGGAGRITIHGGALKDLELDMGVGQLNLTSALSGSCTMDMGVGESNITLLGSKEDYKLDLEKGIGNITVDGKTGTDFGSSGANRVEINGGIGAIRVQFREADVQ